MFMQQMVFTFLHSLLLFRIGCRRGNAEAIIAGREKLSLLFFARNHPSYQRIVALNKYIEAMMPEELKTVVTSSLTLSRTGNIGHYQGGDACLEEINKEAKRWVSPKGVPTDDEWLRVFRNLDGLMQLQKKTLQMTSGVTESKANYTEEQKVDFNEIHPVREMLRDKQYLLCPMEEREHRSLNDEIRLTAEMRNFTAESKFLQDQYLEAFLCQNVKGKRKIIYITEEEKNQKLAIESQTKAEIHKQIFQTLDLKEQNEAKVMEELFNKTVKGKSKEKYVEFYHMVNDDLQ